MRVLEYLENRFCAQSKKVKIELFVFPLIIVVLLAFFYEKPREKVQNDINFTITNKKVNSFKIVKDIEKFANTNSIKIENISSNSNKISITINTKKAKQLMFINYLEYYNNFSNISSLSHTKNTLILELDFKKLYVKNKDKKDIKYANLEEEKLDYKLQAIINKKAMINDKWVNLEEKIDSFTLGKIDSNEVWLVNENETLKLKMYKDENL